VPASPRGYDASLVPGDKALAAAVELQLSTRFESFDDQDAMNSADDGARPGHPVRRSRFRGTCPLQPVPERRNNPDTGISPLYDGAFCWRVLTRF
jgi:hypothetical protein